MYILNVCVRPNFMNLASILEAAFCALDEKGPAGRIPEKWDGHAGERIVEHIVSGAL